MQPLEAREPGDGGPVNANQMLCPMLMLTITNMMLCSLWMMVTAEGGSPNDEAPEPESSWGSLRIHGREPDSKVDRDFDIYVEDLDSDDSEYGSYNC